MTTQIESSVYQAAHDSAVLVDRNQLGVLLFSGATRLDLIHRMSTQDVKGLQRGEGAATILTSDIGRIIDRIFLYPTTHTVYTVTGENHAGAVARYLMRFVFFNDDFQVKDISGETAVFAIYGPKAAEKAARLGFAEVNMPLHHWRQGKIGGADAYLHHTDRIAGGGYFLICHNNDREAIWQHALAAGLVMADEAAFDFLRIEAGLPRFGHELTQEYIPLEANLWEDVSFKKGCYIGQEIIARMESRGKLAKRLVKLKAGSPLAVGSEITTGGKTVGSITSAAIGPQGGIALGYVKTAVLDTPQPLRTGETVLEIVAE